MTLILREFGGLGILNGDGRLLRLKPGAAAVSGTLAVSMLDFVPGASDELRSDLTMALEAASQGA